MPDICVQSKEIRPVKGSDLKYPSLLFGWEGILPAIVNKFNGLRSPRLFIILYISK